MLAHVCKALAVTSLSDCQPDGTGVFLREESRGTPFFRRSSSATMVPQNRKLRPGTTPARSRPGGSAVPSNAVLILDVLEPLARSYFGFISRGQKSANAA